MAEKQTESAILSKAARADGGAKPVKRDSGCAPCEEPRRKRFTIDCVMGGYKLCWSKGDSWVEQEAVSTSVDAVLEAVKAYLTAAEE